MRSPDREDRPVRMCHLTVTAVFRALFLISMLAAGASVRPAAAQTSPRIGVVVTDTDAYLLAPSELISGPVVERVTLSPAGRNVAVLRKSTRMSAANIPSSTNPSPLPPTEEQELIFWNANIRRPVSLWQTAQPGVQISLSDWMPGTESVFAVVHRIAMPAVPLPGAAPEHEWKLLLLGLGIERAVVVPLPTGSYDAVEVNMSPAKSLAVLRLSQSGPEQADALYLVHRNGRLGARIGAVPRAIVTWDAEGSPVLSLVEKRGAVVTRSYFSVDISTGDTRPLSRAPQAGSLHPVLPPALPFHIVTTGQDLVRADTTEHTRPVWLEGASKSEKQRALIAADGANANLLPDASGAMYNATSSLWFTPFVKTTRAIYLTALRAAERVTAISNARQLGLGVIMYAMDNHEILPGPDGIQQLIAPYLKNDSLFNNFTYTYSGGALAGIESPAQTVLGHVDGPGGRAAIYADGHVRWINN